MKYNKEILRKGKKVILSLVALVMAFGCIGIIPSGDSGSAVYAADPETAMKQKADTLVGNTNISCWNGSALILKAADILYFSDPYTETVVGTSPTYNAANHKLGNVTLEVGDVVAIYRTHREDGEPDHTLTYVGPTSGGGTTAKPFLNANYSGTTSYTGFEYSGTPIQIAVRHYTKATSKPTAVEYEIGTESVAGHLTLTPSASQPFRNVTISSHDANGEIAVSGGTPVYDALPKTTFTNANFSDNSSEGSYARVIIQYSAALPSETQSKNEPGLHYYGALTYTVMHSNRSDANFRKAIANKITDTISEFDTIIPATLKMVWGLDDATAIKYANENLTVTGIDVVYVAKAGNQNSSDYEITVKTSVYYDPSITPAPAQNPVITETVYEIGEEIEPPTLNTGEYFMGWYKADKETRQTPPGEAEGYTWKHPGYVSAADKNKTIYGEVYKQSPTASGTITVHTRNVTGEPDPYTPTTGTPIEGIEITLVSLSTGQTYTASDETSADGSVVFANLPYGLYTVTETNLPRAASGNSLGMPKTEDVEYTATSVTNDYNVYFYHNEVAVLDVVFVPNGGAPTPETVTTTSDGYISRTPLTENIARAGEKDASGNYIKKYAFDGWYCDSAFTKLFDFDKALNDPANFGPDADDARTLKLYAKWKELAYKDINIVYTDVNPTNPQDLSSNNFRVRAFEDELTILRDNPSATGKTLSEKLYALYDAGYERKKGSDGSAPADLPGAVIYDKATDSFIDPYSTSGAVITSPITIELVHGIETVETEDATTTPYVRTIHYQDEYGNPIAGLEDVVQTGYTQTTAAKESTDKVTGDKVEVPAQTTLKLGWSSQTSPVVHGWTPDITTVPAVTTMDDLTNPDLADVTVVYSANAVVSRVTVYVTGNVVEVTYDGEEHQVDGWTYEVDPSDSDYDPEAYVTYNGTENPQVGTDAGLYPQRIVAANFENLNENYDVIFVVKQGKLRILPKDVTVRANSFSKGQGEDDPEFTATLTDVLPGDEDQIRFNLYRAEGEFAGVYKIFPAGLHLQGNYNVHFIPGTLVINPLPKPEPEPTVDPEFNPDPHSDAKYIAWHDDILDEAQTISFPGIRTKAADITAATPDDTEQYYYIQDKVHFYNLQPGETYTLVGTLMDKETEQPVEGVDSVSKTFTPAVKEGITPVDFKAERNVIEGKTLVVFERLYLGNEVLPDEENLLAVHEDLTDQDQTVIIRHMALRTTLAGEGTEAKEVPAGISTRVNDVVEYIALEPGDKYRLDGELHVRNAEGQDAGVLEDFYGEPVTASIDFFADDSGDGAVVVPFEFNGLNLSVGDVLVAYERLYKYDYVIGDEGEKIYLDDSVFVIEHADINDEAQTVTITELIPVNPRIATTATDSEGQKEVPLGSEVTIVDLVEYEDLYPRTTYLLSGELHHVRGTTDLGVVSYSEAEFTTGDESSGAAEIEFAPITLIRENFKKDDKLVVFETLYELPDEDSPVAEHADLTDEGQTVTIVPQGPEPSIGTKLAYLDGEKVAPPSGQITLNDVVSYASLEVDKEYVLEGELHVKNPDGTDGGILTINGVEVKATQTFTPKSPNGTVTVPFTFDASGLNGKSVVAFETLYQGDLFVTDHANIDDADQTVDIKIQIGTKLSYTDGSKVVPLAESITLNDVVSYKGLTPNQEYILKGELHVKKADGSDGGVLKVDGKEVTASVTFKPEKSDGAVTVPFTFKSSDLNGSTLVAFETLFMGELQIADHRDIKDADQTVEIKVEIGTKAYYTDGSKNVPANAIVKVNDDVTYSGLTPNKEYTVVGALHVKKSDGSDGGVLRVDGKEITASMRFTPTTSSGKVTVVFEFNSAGLDGQTLVAFEKLYLGSGSLDDKNLIASHEKIDAESQTVVVQVGPTPPPTNNNTNTGSSMMGLVFGGTTLVALVALALIVVYKKSNDKKAE